MEHAICKAALVVIDLENGFVAHGSPHRIATAEETLPACAKVIRASREHGIPVIFVKRIYRQDGSDVEITRWKAWNDGGRSMGPSSTGSAGAEAPAEVRPEAGDYTLIKPRWSAFFQTELDLLLRRLGINTVVLIGTTTPNCIRTTAYDANAMDYEVVIVEDCCSSQTAEIQKANIEDLRRMGAVISDSSRFCTRLPGQDYQGYVEQIRKDIQDSNTAPEPIRKQDGGHAGWLDIW